MKKTITVLLFSISLFSADLELLQKQCFKLKLASSCSSFGSSIINQNLPLAQKAYKLGIELNDKDSFVYWGNLYWNDTYSSTKLRGFKMLSKAADRKDFNSAIFVAKTYATGLSPVRQNFQQSEKYFKLASFIDRRNGSLPLAEFYEGVYGNIPNYKLSNMFYIYAVNTSNDHSLTFKVAKWNFEGTHGFKKNTFIATTFLNRLSASGYKPAINQMKMYNIDISYIDPNINPSTDGF